MNIDFVAIFSVWIASPDDRFFPILVVLFFTLAVSGTIFLLLAHFYILFMSTHRAGLLVSVSDRLRGITLNINILQFLYSCVLKTQSFN